MEMASTAKSGRCAFCEKGLKAFNAQLHINRHWKQRDDINQTLFFYIMSYWNIVGH